jgi:penicillin-binding protein 2
MALTHNAPIASKSSPTRTARTVGQQYQSLLVMLIISVAMIGGIGSRLAYLQIFQGERNRQLAENNRIRLIPRQPERGKILDRKGKTLAGSRLSYSVFLWPISNSKENWQEILVQLSDILNVPIATLQKPLEKASYTSPELVRVARGISPAQVTVLAELGRS